MKWFQVEWSNETGRVVKMLVCRPEELPEVLELPMPEGAVAREPVTEQTMITENTPFYRDNPFWTVRPLAGGFGRFRAETWGQMKEQLRNDRAADVRQAERSLRAEKSMRKAIVVGASDWQFAVSDERGRIDEYDEPLFFGGPPALKRLESALEHIIGKLKVRRPLQVICNDNLYFYDSPRSKLEGVEPEPFDGGPATLIYEWFPERP